MILTIVTHPRKTSARTCRKTNTTVFTIFSGLINLKHLYLYGNKIQTLPFEIGRLNQLEILQLKKKISGLDQALSPQLSQLL